MSDAARLLQTIEEAGLIGFFVFLRVGAAAALFPGFGEQSIPARVRLILALSFTIIVAPALDPKLHLLAASALASPLVWIGEALIGLMLGLSLRLSVMILQMAGTIIAQSVSLSQVFASAGSEPMTVIGEFLVLGGIALAVTLGLHVELARCIIDSYQDFPPGISPQSGEALDWAIDRASGALRFAFALSAPFVGGALLYNLALGMINKAMPQLMVAMVGAPALTLGGLFLLLLSAPVILSTWIHYLGAILAQPF